MPTAVNKLNLFNMSRTGLWVTQKFRSVVDVVHASRFQSIHGRPAKNITTSGYNCMPPTGLQLISTNSNTTSINANGVKNVKVRPPTQASPKFNFFYRLRWVLGSVLSLLLPFWKHYWEKLKRIEGEAEFVVEKVANVVENVAVATEKASEYVTKKFPEDGKINKVAMVVECVSKHAAHDAQLTQEFIHKVDQVKNGLDELESFVEPMIDNIVNNEYGSEMK